MGGITLVALPYDSGHFDERMGCGPLHLLEGGLADRLRSEQQDVEVRTVRLSEKLRSEGQALVELQKLAVPEIRDAIGSQRRVLILSGNCGPAAMSAISALNPRKTGVIWFDAHADFNTPETSASGFLDGMALAILTGRCWSALAARFLNFEPVPEANVILVGIRDLDAPEAEALNRSSIKTIAPDQMELFDQAVTELSARVEYLYVHLDVDVLDESEGRANSYASSRGLTAAALSAALKSVRSHRRIDAASITAYEPGCERNGRILTIIDRAAAILTGS